MYCAANLSLAQERVVPLQPVEALMRLTMPAVSAGYPASVTIHPEAMFIVVNHPLICVAV